MGCNKNNAFFVTTVIFMIPLIVLSSLILSTKIKTENLEKIIDAPHNPSDCYDLTYSFVKEQNTDERYISLNTYLKSLTPLCIVIIVFYSIKIIFTLCFSGIIEPDMMDGVKWYVFMLYGCPSKNYIFYSNNSLCNIIKNQRIYNKLRSVHELL